MGSGKAMKLLSPYENGLNVWLRGNLHAHTTNSDGEHAPQQLIDAYAVRNFDFLMISDHDVRTPPESVDCRGMILIPGVEVTANGPHILHVNAQSLLNAQTDRQSVINAINAEGGFAVINHPNWGEDFNHCPQETLEALEDYVGIEIYNGVIRHLAGSPLATNRWDRLLGQGRRVWGFANDDCHREGDEQIAWMMVQQERRESNAILESLRAGAFYGTTGVQIYNITTEGTEVTLETENATKIVVLGDYGRRLTEVYSNTITFNAELTPEYTYIRFEAYGYGEACAWTQPFFLHCE